VVFDSFNSSRLLAELENWKLETGILSHSSVFPWRHLRPAVASGDVHCAIITSERSDTFWFLSHYRSVTYCYLFRVGCTWLS